MCKTSRLRPGAWFAIAVGIAVAIFASVDALGQDRLTIDRQGDASGTTVVFIPGLATPGSVFQPYVDRHTGLDAHLLTLAGFAGAPALDPTGGVILPAAEALAAYLRAEDLSDVVLVGHSLGGEVALLTAGHAADRVEHVIVVDSLPFFQGFMNPAAVPELTRAQGEAMLPVLANMERAAFMTMIERGAPVQATSPGHQAQIVSYVAQSDQRTVAPGTFEALSLDWRPGLERVKANVTLLVPHNSYLGVAEHVIGARYAAQYSAVEALDVRVIPDSRHFIMLDQPDAFAEALERVVGAPS